MGFDIWISAEDRSREAGRHGEQSKQRAQEVKNTGYKEEDCYRRTKEREREDEANYGYMSTSNAYGRFGRLHFVFILVGFLVYAGPTPFDAGRLRPCSRIFSLRLPTARLRSSSMETVVSQSTQASVMDTPCFKAEGPSGGTSCLPALMWDSIMTPVMRRSPALSCWQMSASTFGWLLWFFWELPSGRRG